MDLLGLVVVLVIIGAALAIVPMDPTIKRAIIIVVLVVVALLLLRAFLPPIRLGRLMGADGFAETFWALMIFCAILGSLLYNTGC